MSYSQINWENAPSTKTPINAENLKHMDEGIAKAHEIEAQLELYKANSIISTSSGTVFHESDCAAVPPINIKLFGKSKQDGMPSIETPIEVVSHGESGSIGGKLLTGNLLSEQNIIDFGFSKIGENEFYTQHSSKPYQKILFRNIYGYQGQFKISGLIKYVSQSNYVGVILRAMYTDGTCEWIEASIIGQYQEIVFISNKNKVLDYIDCDSYGTGSTETYLKNMQVSFNTSAQYEPYTEQPFTALTPNGLRGIPLGKTIPDAIKNSHIHMNGVYWDSVEQQNYIADTKNENGKDVQRIGKERLLADKVHIIDSLCNEETNLFWLLIGAYYFSSREGEFLCDIATYNPRTVDGIDTNNGGCLNVASNNMFYIRLRKDSGVSTLEEFMEYLTNNEVYVYVILQEPIVTETDAQYNVVMNYPNTTIINDAGAYMEVTHVKDTQKHIEQNYVSKEAYNEHENRIAELEKAIVNS